MERLTDEQLEVVISTYQQLAQGSKGPIRGYWYQLMVVAIKSRSPAQIRKLEIDKGLRAA